MRLGFTGQPRDQDFGRGTRKRRDVVVLGNPVTLVAEAIREARELDGVGERLARSHARGNGGLVDDGEFHLVFSKLNENRTKSPFLYMCRSERFERSRLDVNTGFARRKDPRRIDGTLD